MSQGRGEPAAKAKPGEGRALLALALAGFASAVSMRLIDPVTPQISREFSRSIDQVALLTVVFTYAYAATQPIMGPIADAIGKTRVMVGCVMAVAILNMVAALSPSFPMLLTVRTAAGIFAGGIIPVALAAVGDLVAIERRQLALARVMVAILTGQIGGATIAGLVGGSIGWRGVLVTAGLLSLSAGIAVLASSRGAPPPQRRPLSLSGVIAGYRSVFANPMAIPLLAGGLIEGMMVYGLFPYIAAMLEHRSGVGPFEAGLVIGAFAVGGLIYGVGASLVLRWLTPRAMMIGAGLLMGGALCVLSFELPWWTAIGVMLVHGFGFYLLHSNYQTMATDLSREARGAALSVFASALFIGTGTGPLVFGALFPRLGERGAILVAAVALAALSWSSLAILARWRRGGG